ncbi:invasion associated locus B family protein (plasmid) [Devosia sp. A8/3-2]|nr:invasion associated locus B family protein [Devosia sp. A8/3-2]
MVAGREDPNNLNHLLTQSHEVVAQATQGSDRLGEALQVAQAGQSASAATLPNGASSITETFGDWTVNCAIQNDQKVCATSQAQGNSQTGQQVFAIELYASQQGVRNGVLILPFGLDIQSPVTLKIDEQALGSGSKFTTCMPGGCVVPVVFPPNELEALKKGTMLVIAARSASAPAEPAEFSVSLSGFTAALGRIDQLTP